MARNKNGVTVENFLRAYYKAVEDKKTMEELAAEVNLKPLSCYQKASKLARVLAKEGVVMPKMAGNVKKDTLPELFALAKELGKVKEEAPQQ